MSNRERGTVTVEIEGRTYTLIFDMNAICEVEELFSTPEREVSFEQITRRVQAGSMRHIRGIVWAALRRHHPDVTLPQVGDLIQQLGMAQLNASLSGLVATMRPDAEDVQANLRPPKAQRRGGRGGVNSTPSPVASA